MYLVGYKLSPPNCISDCPGNGRLLVYRDQFGSEHVARRLENNKDKYCYFCKINRVKIKSGYNIKSRFKCSKCDVSLCLGERMNRNCFYMYHEMLRNKSK